MSIKFTDLSSVSVLQPDDVFAVTVDSTNTSKKIDFSTLQSQILDQAVIRTVRNDIITVINENSTTLNSDLLDGQHGSYYLDYTNFNNTPTLITNLHQLDNSQVDDDQTGAVGGFVRLRGSDNKLIFQRRESGTNLTPTVVTTSNVDEGLNLYYTEDRVTTYFDEYFAQYFNKYNITFDQGNVADSYFDTVGFAPAVSSSGETMTLRVKAEGNIPGVSSDYEKREQGARFKSYEQGKNIRIFGADSAENADPMTNKLVFTDSSYEVVGFNTPQDSTFAGATPTFNAATGVEVTPGSNTITMNAVHNLDEGEAVIYNSGGAPSITGLTSGNTYYVKNPSGANLQLIANPGDTQVIIIDVGTGDQHTLTPIRISTPFQRIAYEICEWDMTTGKVSPPTAEIAKNIGVPTTVQDPALVEAYLGENQERILQSFSVENFIKLQLTYNDNGSVQSGVTPGRGICIYRRVSQINTIDEQLKGTPKLVAVLGPLELKENYWIDYFTDDVLTHSGKNQEDNSYLPENTVHFKAYELPNANSGERGWVDAVIRNVEYENPVNPDLSTYIDINLTSNVVMDAGETNGAWICHDDTAVIQSAIDTNSGSGRKAIQFNPKDYIVSSVSIPEDFSVAGYAYNTKLIKLPWSGWNGSTASASATMLKFASSRLRNTSFVGIDIDGNSINSIGFDDTSDATKNFAINLGQFNDGVLLDKVRLKKPIGGGVYAVDPINLKIIGCEFLDSGITDRHVFSPLLADGGKNTFVSSNRFENFSKGSVDVSITDKGAVEGNVISNCGSGLVIFGSRFMITGPNVLTGPSSEFLPQPDAFNSEFDSINIDLTEASLHASGVQAFDSGPMKYQENGEVYDLEAGPVYKIFAIKKDADSGEESIWVDDLRPPTGFSQERKVVVFNATNDSDYNFATEEITVSGTGTAIFAYSATLGSVAPSTQYRIVSGAETINTTQMDALATVPTQAADLRTGLTFTTKATLPADMTVYQSLVVAPVIANHGLVTGDIVYYDSRGGVSPSSELVSGSPYFVYAPNTTEIMLFNADNRASAMQGSGAGKVNFVDGGGTGEQNLATGTAHTFTRNSYLEINQGSEGDNPASEGGFQWTIPADTVRRIKLAGQPYTVESMRDPTKKVYHRGPNLEFAETAGDPEHVGLGWSASVTQFVDSAMIVNNAGNPGVWSESGGDVFYTITVRDYKYLVEGRKVRPKDLGIYAHQSFSPGTGGGPFGIIDDIGEGTDEKVITIRWPNANISDALGGYGGMLEAENTFVIATGRIK